MICTIVMSFLISINSGPWECRVKHFDRETAIQELAYLNEQSLHPDFKIRNVKSFIPEEPFKCGDEKVVPDDKHNGCRDSSNQIYK